MMVNIITVDGYSGVGKGTLAQKLADYYSFHLLDSGALYRVVAVNAKKLSLDFNNESEIIRAIEDLVIEFNDNKVFLHNQDVSKTIRTLAIGQLASKVAVYPSVRDKLLKFMQDFVQAPGIVADGRDMGTVVFPQANLKIFLTASIAIRAKRRYKQLKDCGKDVNLCDVFSDIHKRDERDKGREIAPLEPAKDAVVINTDDLGVSQVFKQVKIQAVLRGILP